MFIVLTVDKFPDQNSSRMIPPPKPITTPTQILPMPILSVIPTISTSPITTATILSIRRRMVPPLPKCASRHRCGFAGRVLMEVVSTSRYMNLCNANVIAIRPDGREACDIGLDVGDFSIPAVKDLGDFLEGWAAVPVLLASR